MSYRARKCCNRKSRFAAMMVYRSSWMTKLCFAEFVVLVIVLYVLGNRHDDFSGLLWSSTNLRSNEVDQQEPGLCKVYDIALMVGSSYEARKAGMMLKTLFYHRKSPLRLHIIVRTNFVWKIMKTLMETWDMNQVDFHIYGADSSKIGHIISDDDWRVLPFRIWKYLPKSIKQLVYLSNRMRLMDGIERLWAEIESEISFNVQHVIGLNKDSDCSFTQMTCCCSLIYYDLRFLRNSTFGLNLELAETPARISEILNDYKHVISYLPCHWTIHLNETMFGSQRENGCFEKSVKGLVWNEVENRTIFNPLIEEYKEHVISILNSETLLRKPLSCYIFPEVVEKWRLIRDPCYKYRQIQSVKHRTHLFYLGKSRLQPDDGSDGTDVGIGLLTQMTIDRFASLEKIIARWKGHASVVLYLSDAEALELPDKVRMSPVLSLRTNIVYHVVFKRQELYPVNYLRNVALDNNIMPFIFYLDVDLVPVTKLYPSLQKYAKRYLGQQNYSKLALVVPAFEAGPTISFNDKLWPRNKPELLPFLLSNQMWPFRFKKFKKGHQPSNYTHWLTCTTPYKIPFQYGYEPYVLLRAASLPRFHEALLDRVGNKLGYIYHLHNLGYEFVVLPDDYLMHLWHPLTSATVKVKQDRNWFRCGVQIRNNYIASIHAMYNTTWNTTNSRWTDNTEDYIRTKMIEWQDTNFTHKKTTEMITHKTRQ